MLFYLLAYLGGLLTIVSPCVLPVVPFLFVQADRSFWRSILPMLSGMAVTFALVAAAAAVGGGWIVRANEAGRIAAMVVLAAMGIALLVPTVADLASRPLVAIGARLQQRARTAPPVVGAALLGVSIGFLWAPCAGPILGLLFTTAALKGATAHSALLLLTFAAGACSALGVALVAGGRIYDTMKRSMRVEGTMRRLLGAAVLAGVLVIAMGWDTAVLAKVRLPATTRTEEGLISRFAAAPPATKLGKSLDEFVLEEAPLADEGQMPDLIGATGWLNTTQAITRESLKGKVVLVQFWTFACYNCRNALPYVKGYYEKYKDKGLVVIGVHTPELPFEKDRVNVERAIHDLGVLYPVPLDNDYRIWRAFNNEYWPAAYFIDATGRIRYHHFGEGRYDEQDRVIQKLLAEARLLTRRDTSGTTRS
ncbi:MAG: cytochrome c biogenesis protein DipZ [Gemmatimonadaceae bacterium]